MQCLIRASLGHLAIVFASAMGAACDSAAQPAPLIGAWSSDVKSNAPAARYEFRPDGTFFVEDHKDAPPLTATGTYAATDTMLTLEGTVDNGNTYRLATTYYSNEESLYLWVFHPDRDAPGVAATWTGSMDLQVSGQNEIAFRGDVSFVLGDDGSAALSYALISTIAGDVDELVIDGEGTYHELTAGTYHLSFPLAQEAGASYTLELTLRLIDGAVLTGEGFTFALGAE